MITRLCIVRHGETDWNAEKRIQGQTDVPLNETGIRQARSAAAGLAAHRFEAIYSSDLARALATAQEAAARLGLSPHTEPGLRERHYGLFQGRTAVEMAACHPELHERYRARDPDHDLGGGESLRGFAGRVGVTVERLAARHPGATLLLVAHGGVLDIVYRRATGRDLSAPRDFEVPNAALNWIEVGPDGWRLVSWADRRHLADTLLEAAE